MKQFIGYCFLVCLPMFAGAQSPAPANDEYKDAIRLIDQWLEAQVAFDQLPGLSVGIVKDQELIWSKGYGYADTERKVPMQANTIYSICSISKLFTSVAILQLRDAGKLQLDDEVSKWLSWFKIEQSFHDSGPITIRSLLTHSSGLPRESDFPYWTEAVFPSRDEVIEKIKDQKTLYPAGSYYQYSNLGMTLLGFIVEEVSGMPYDQYMQQNILKPLQTSSTRTYFPSELWRGKMATGYSDLSRKGARRMIDKFDTKGLTAAAGYTSTVEDMARFASWQFRLVKNGGAEVLRSSTLREMHQVQYMDPNWKSSWGFGFRVTHEDGKTYVSHGGYCPGYQSLIALNPKDQWAFIVMINANGTDPWKYFTGMRHIVTKACDEKLHEKNKDAYESFAGLYGAKLGGGELLVTPWGDKLAAMNLPSDNPKHGISFLKHIEDDKFRRVRDDGELGEEIFFERDKAGKVAKIWWHSNYRVKLQ